MSKAQFSRIQVMLIKVVFDEKNIITIVSTLRGLVPYLDVIDPCSSCFVEIHSILGFLNVL